MRTGREYLAIPGPSVIPERVLAAMHQGSPDIYAPEIEALAASLQADLKRVAGTKHDAAIYIANGHGTWEAALCNIFSPGDHGLFLANRHFGLGWAGMAERLGVKAEVLDFGRSGAIDVARVSEVLKADQAHKIKAVLAVHVDTASSAKNDIPALRKAIDAAGHPALLAIDCIASLGCDEFRMDDFGVDVMVAACQKGLMTPPGMGFVFFGPKAAAMRESAKCVTHYWDWKPRADPQEFWQYWDGTAPTHHLFGLRAALDMIFEEGLPQVWARHARLARAYWAALDAWSAGGPLKMNVAKPSERSHAVTAVSAGPGSEGLRAWLTANTGVTLGIGLGMAPANDPARDQFFRIGHMGHVNAQMVLGVIGAIETGLTALQIPHGKGALEAAAGILAG
jgi:alanine-glyoxylate transaminase / serine-glyoxylate transaminase / serine-pyruvate transaminase